MTKAEQHARRYKRVLFARVGWMKRYDGSAPDDKKPLGGGSYNERHKGHELFNFHDHEGQVFGFIQPAYQRRRKGRRLNLARISPAFDGEKLDDVLVVFVARREGKGHQEIVGWYRDATVYYEEQSGVLHGRRRTYSATTKSANACLVDPNWRKKASKKMIGMGQADISYRYALDGEPRNLPGIDDALRFINTTPRSHLLRLCVKCAAVPKRRTASR